MRPDISHGDHRVSTLVCHANVTPTRLTIAGWPFCVHDVAMTTKDAIALAVMQFNIEYGGDGVAFASVGKAIRAAGADIVAIQEGCAKMPDIAADLGWEYWDARTQVVSTYPLLSPVDISPGTILVEVAPGKVIGIVNVHPPSRGYGPTRLSRGQTVDKVIRSEERVRGAALEPSLASARSLKAQGIPVVLLGDFNAPSHRDWTPEMVGRRAHVKCSMNWPTSIAAEADGLTDVYRTVFPDPVRHPGLTWPATRPFVAGYNPGRAGHPADRIDLMYVGGAIEPTAIRIVGEEGSPMSDVTVSPWPTDHRALVADLEVIPGPTPALVSIDRRCSEVGGVRVVRYHALTGDAREIALVEVNAPASEPLMSQRVDDPVRGATRISTSDLPAGRYELVLVGPGAHELARTRMWLMAPGGSPAVSTSQPRYPVGAAIDVAWDFAPGNKSDWIAVFDRGLDPPARARVWRYIDAEVEGRVRIDGQVRPRRWPLEAGSYRVRLMQDDSSIQLAHADFDVVSAD
jgi:endonuclease/exonuclease/phosphatase family metal-dependent hydrolase